MSTAVPPEPTDEIALPGEAAEWSDDKRAQVVAIARVLLGKGEKTGTRPVLKAYTFGELIRKRFDPGHALLGRHLLDRGGAMVVAGVQKIAKSFLAVQAMMSVVTRRTFLDLPPAYPDPNYAPDGTPQPVSALMLQGEVSDRNMKDRLLRTVAHYSHTTPGATKLERDAAARSETARVVFTHHHIKLDDPESMVWLAELLYDHGSPALPQYSKPYRTPDIVVMDPFAWFHGLDENSTQEMARVCGALDRLRHGLGIAVIVVHHASKGSTTQSNPGHKMRGSTVLAGWYETLIQVSWKGGVGGPRRLEFEMRNGVAPDEMICVFDPNSNCLVPVTSEEFNPLDYNVLLALSEYDHELKQYAALDDGFTADELNKRLKAAHNDHRLTTKDLRNMVLRRMLEYSPAYIERFPDPHDAERRAKRVAEGGSPAGAPTMLYKITPAGLARIPIYDQLYAEQRKAASFHAEDEADEEETDD